MSEILGVRVDDVTMAEAVARVEALMQEPRCHQVVTVNTEFVMLARRDPEFARALAAADLNVPDAANLIRGARMLGYPLRERVAGSDLVWALAARAAERGWRIFLLGAREGVAAQAAEKLRARYPRLQLAGVFAGSPDPRVQAEIAARVNAGGADILFVAYGAPAQELWIARNRDSLRVRVALGVGGAFDFIAGRLPRAPRWLQRAGLEWLFRLLLEPWRVRRQWALVEFTLLLLRRRFWGL